MTLLVHFRAFVVYCAIFLLCFANMATASTDVNIEQIEQTNNAYTITNFQWEQTADEFLLRILGNTQPTYTMYQLFEPLRIIIDIADASIDANVSLPIDLQHGPVFQVNGTTINDKKPAIARIEIFLTSDQAYSVEREENDILVRFAKKTVDEEGNETTSLPTDTEKEMVEEALAETVDDQTEEIAPTFKQESSTIFDIDVEKTSSETRVHVKADGPLVNFQKMPLPKANSRPDRLYVDFPNVKIDIPDSQIEVNTTLARIRAARREKGVRIVFDSGINQLFDFKIYPMSYGLMIVIPEAESSELIAGILEKDADTAETVDPINSIQQAAKPDTIANQDVASKSSKIDELLEDFSFGGYAKKKITVDFYKIDLHNVFRLFGEISDLNIVVDEGVAGSLTLSLNEVPWDFALDIILNLKDLQKEERFNTIVISPKSKNFSWPERTTDNIAFKVDESAQKPETQIKEAITIRKKIEQPKELLEAKKILVQAQSKEKTGNYEGALKLYEEAFSLWKDNAQLAKRIASLCLVQLNMNAKAAYYAKSALNINAKDNSAALQAAIANANMKKIAEAEEYFNLAVGGTSPEGEALISYSAFAEENQHFDTAISMLQKHGALYGDTLDTMISKARIYDKMGQRKQAVEEYRALLHSGFDLPPDLARYIKGRISMENNI